MNCISNKRGFTLIEMAIVLVIIGLILAAVTKGQDLVQSAQQKKFYSSFVKAWELAVINYQDRTGHLLMDGTDNGGTKSTDDGHFDSTPGSGTIGSAPTALERVGLDSTLPATNTDNSYTYKISGKYSGEQTVKVTLEYVSTVGNYIRFTNIPTDVAMGMDAIIDGDITGKRTSYSSGNNEERFMQSSPTPPSFDGDAPAWSDPKTQKTVQAIYRLTFT
jgi:prepilin-type N-terminal cleavage/methylation domain-containing protein